MPILQLLNVCSQTMGTVCHCISVMFHHCEIILLCHTNHAISLQLNACSQIMVMVCQNSVTMGERLIGSSAITKPSSPATGLSVVGTSQSGGWMYNREGVEI